MATPPDLDDIAEMLADSFRDKYADLVNDVSDLNDHQQQLLADIAQETDEERKRALKENLKVVQRRIGEVTEEIDEGIASNWDQWSREEKEAFKEESKLIHERNEEVQKEVDRLFGKIHRNIEDAERDIDGLDQNFSETLDKWADELRDWANALNLDALVSQTEETVDNYIQNLREMRVSAGSMFDEDAFNNSVSNMVEELSSYSRNEASEFMSNFMKEYSFKRVDEAAQFSNEIAAANKAFGNSISDYENMVRRDLKTGQNGDLVRSANNLAASLQDNQDLYANGADILASINENINGIYGLQSKDSKKQKGLIESVAAIKAIQETIANDGMDTIAGKVTKWGTMSLPELMNDENFLTFQSLTNISAEDFQAMMADSSGEGRKEIFMQLHDALNSIGGDDEVARQYNLESWKNDLGFDSYAEINQFAGMNRKEISDAIDAVTSSVKDANMATDSGQSLAEQKESQSVGWIDDFMNELTNLPFVRAISDFFADFDITAANAANLALIASSGVNIVSKIFGGTSLGGLVNSLQGLIGQFTPLVSSASIGTIASAFAGAVVPAIAGLAAGGGMIYDSASAFSKAKEEKDNENLGTSLGYAGSGLLQAGGGTAVAAGGVAAGAAIGGSLLGGAGLAAALTAATGGIALPLIAIGAAAYGIGKLGESAIDSMKEIDSFGKGVDKIAEKSSKAIENEMDKRQESMFKIQEETNLSTGSMEDLNDARQSLEQSGISQEAAALIDSKKELIAFTQNMIQASEAAKSFADAKLDEEAEELKDQLSAQFTNEQKDKASEDLQNKIFGDKSSFDANSEDSSERVGYKTAVRKLQKLGETITDEDEKKAYQEKLKEAMEDKVITREESADLVWGKDYSALNSTSLDIDKFSEFQKLNGLEQSVDTTQFDQFKSFSQDAAKMEADYQNWKTYVNSDADGAEATAQQMVSDFQEVIESAEEKPGWSKYSKRSTYEGYAHEMGIEGYANGLSYVPNEGLAYLHKGESVIPAVNARPDGGPDIESAFKEALSDGYITEDDVQQLIENTQMSADELSSLTDSVDDKYAFEEEKTDDLEQLVDNLGLTDSDLGMGSGLGGKDDIFSKMMGGGGTGKAFSKMMKGKGSGGGFFSRIKSMFSGLLGGSSGGGSSGGGSRGAGSSGGGGGGGNIVATQSTGENKKDTWNFLTSNGFTPQAAAGVMGNLQQESGFDPLITEDRSQAGWSTLKDVKKGGAGIAQWTDPGRCDNFDSYMASNGLDPHDLSSQLQFMLYEAQTGYGSLVADVSKMTDIDQATAEWESRYEGAGTPMLDQRIQYAHDIYDEFAGNSYAKGTPFLPEDQVAMVHEGEMIIPKDKNPIGDLISGATKSFDLNSIISSILGKFNIGNILGSLGVGSSGGILPSITDTIGKITGSITGEGGLGGLLSNITKGLDLSNIGGIIGGLFGHKKKDIQEQKPLTFADVPQEFIDKLADYNKIKEDDDELVRKAKEANILKLYEAQKKDIQDTVQEQKDTVQEVTNGIGGSFNDLGKLFTVGGGFAGSLGDGLGSITDLLSGKGFGDIFNSVKDIFSGDGLNNILKGGLGNLGNIGNTLKNAMGSIGDIFGSGGVENILGIDTSNIGKMFSVGGGFGGALSEGLGSITGSLSGALSTVADSAEQVVDASESVESANTENIALDKQNNPMANPASTVEQDSSVTEEPSSSSDVIETMKWQVSRLEAKLDQLIAATGGAGSGRGSRSGEGGVNGGYSPEIDAAFSALKTPGLGVV